MAIGAADDWGYLPAPTTVRQDSTTANLKNEQEVAREDRFHPIRTWGAREISAISATSGTNASRIETEYAVFIGPRLPRRGLAGGGRTLAAAGPPSSLRNRNIYQGRTRFLPHTIPAFAAASTQRDLGKTFPGYSYKEAALNPTNPANRATPEEKTIIERFRSGKAQDLVISTRDPPWARSFRWLGGSKSRRRIA